MQRTVLRVIGIVAAAAVLPGLVWVAGTAIEPPTETRSPADQSAPLTRSGPDVCLDSPITSSVGASGQGIFCLTGSDARVTLQVSGLAPGQAYAVWLSAAAPDPAEDSGPDPTRLILRLGEELASPSGTLEVHSELHDARLARGARIVLLILRPGARAGPHAQSSFVVP